MGWGREAGRRGRSGPAAHLKSRKVRDGGEGVPGRASRGELLRPCRTGRAGRTVGDEPNPPPAQCSVQFHRVGSGSGSELLAGERVLHAGGSVASPGMPSRVPNCAAGGSPFSARCTARPLEDEALLMLPIRCETPLGISRAERSSGRGAAGNQSAGSARRRRLAAIFCWRGLHRSAPCPAADGRRGCRRRAAPMARGVSRARSVNPLSALASSSA